MQKILEGTASAKIPHFRSALMVVQNASDIDPLTADWVDLASRVPAHSMSQTAEFAGTALDLAARQGKECLIITIRHANKLVGVWGLVKSRSGIHRILQPFSCGTHEEMSPPLIEPQFDSEIADALVKIAVSIKADRIFFYNLPRSGAVDRAVERLKYFQRIDFMQSYLIDKKSFPNWQSVESHLSKSFRSQLRRYEKKLSERGKLEFGWSRTAKDATQVLEFIYKTKRAWLKRKSLRSHWLNKDEVRDFFYALIQKPGFGRIPIIGWIKLDGDPIAGGLYISTEDCVEALITTFDPRYSDVSCGNILIKHGISLSLETDRSYDIGLGSADYKERWSATPRFFTTRIVMRSSVGMIPNLAELKGMLRTLRNRFLRPSNKTLAEHRGEWIQKSSAAEGGRHGGYWMSVAVVIAAYNAQDSIERAINSVLCQTLRPSDIIVVNDASTDNTLAVVEALSRVSKEIRTISLGRNSGPSCARNAAIHSTTADWIAILDADDAWKPERLERLLDAAEKERIDFIADNFIYFDAVAGVESGFGFDPSSARRLISIENVISSDIIGHSTFVLGLLQPIMRREFLTSNRIFYNENTQLAEDTELLMDSLIAGAKVLLLPEPYYIYSTPIGHFSGKPSPHQRTKLRLDVMAENNRLLEKKYAGLVSPGTLSLLHKRGRQLMARHHAIAASQYKRRGRIFHYAFHHFRHPGLIGLKVAIWKERVASLFQR